MQERGELYVAIAVSRLGVGVFPSYLTYKGTVRLVQWPSEDHRWRSRGCFLYTFREGRDSAVTAAAVSVLGVLEIARMRRRMDGWMG